MDNVLKEVVKNFDALSPHIFGGMSLEEGDEYMKSLTGYGILTSADRKALFCPILGEM